MPCGCSGCGDDVAAFIDHPEHGQAQRRRRRADAGPGPQRATAHGVGDHRHRARQPVACRGGRLGSAPRRRAPRGVGCRQRTRPGDDTTRLARSRRRDNLPARAAVGGDESEGMIAFQPTDTSNHTYSGLRSIENIRNRLLQNIQLVRGNSAIQMLGPIKNLLLPYKSLVFILVGVAFVVALSISIRKYNSKRVRSVFLVFFFSCLLLTTLGGQHVLPFTQWHKFSTTGETEASHHTVQLITESGERVPIDKGVMEGMVWRKLASLMVTDYNQTERENAAQEVVLLSNEHRNETLRDQPFDALSLLSFPSHGFGSTDWKASMLEENGRFVGMTVVQVDLSISKDGRKLESRSTELQFEWTKSDGITNSTQAGSMRATA